MSLGNKLAKNIQDKAFAEASAKAAQEELDRKIEEGKNKEVKDWCNKMIDQLTAKINGGDVKPYIKIGAKIERILGIGYNTVHAPGKFPVETPYAKLVNKTLYKWAADNNLILEIIHEHDGMGMESWRALIARI